MASEYDDELWTLVPHDAAPPPRHLAEWVRSLGDRDGAVLDLGCGDGRLTPGLGGQRVVAADASPVALDRARERLEDAGIEIAEVTPGAALPWVDGTFELVLLAETIEHVVDVELLLAEVRRVLAPGGEVAISTPHHSRHSGWSLLLRGFERTFDPLSPHVRFFDRGTLDSVLVEAGFQVSSTRRKGDTLFVRASR